MRFSPENLWIPKWLAFAMGALSEFDAWLISPIKKFNPKFSRFAVIYTCNEFTFNSIRTKTDFGLQPKYSTHEATERTIKYYLMKT